MPALQEALFPRNRRGFQQGRVFNTPPPIGGLNTKDPLAAMGRQYASVMENWWPTQSDVQVREGYIPYLDDLGQPIVSLFSYLSSNTSARIGKLFAATETDIWDVSYSDMPEIVQGGLNGGAFQTQLFSTEGGDYLIALNGRDDLLLFDGIEWKKMNASSTPAITGVDTSTLISCTVFKQRLWFAQQNSLFLYYLPVGSIGGQAKLFDVSSIFTKGGSIAFITTWTAQTGSNLNHMLVIMTTEGEVAVYQGTNPDEYTDFTIVANFFLARPIQKCFTNYGTDILFLTESGIFALSKVMRQSSINYYSTPQGGGITDIYSPLIITDKITPNILAAVQSFRNNIGWELRYFPQKQMVLLNVPLVMGVESVQFALNTLTGAWTFFTGLSSNSWVDFNGVIYFAREGKIFRAFYGFSDNEKQIVAFVRPAFSNFGINKPKHVKLVRPLLTMSGEFWMTWQVEADFKAEPVKQFTERFNAPFDTTPSEGSSIWDSSIWDDAIWDGGGTFTVSDIFKEWLHTNSSLGLYLTCRWGVSVNGTQLRWQATQFEYTAGGML